MRVSKVVTPCLYAAEPQPKTSEHFTSDCYSRLDKARQGVALNCPYGGKVGTMKEQ